MIGKVGILRTLLWCLTLLFLYSCGADKYMKKGDAFYAIGEYYDAAAEYKKAYSHTPTKDKEKRGERAWKMADCYRRINYTAKAIGGYQNAIRYAYPDSMALFYLAQAQQKQGDYKAAIKSYDAFLEIVPNHPLAMAGKQGCMQAPIWKNKPTLYSIKKEPIFNSRRADFSPMLAGDEFDQLYLTTTRPQTAGTEVSGITGTKSADIFVSKKDDKGKWSQPEAIEGEFSSEYDEGVSCLSPDGKTMYLTRCTFDADYPRFAEICTSQRSDAAWSKPQTLQITKDTLSSYAHPAVSPDGNWLYFTSDMPGGMGGKDIWRIAIGEHGLGGVENLGEPINTPGDEMFPVFRPNGDLYFSSNGHPGMGGLDIFLAQCDTLGRWTVENLRYPMNSAGDDFGMTFEGLHNRGFFSTNRGDARGWDHIMSFECPEVIQTVKGWVYEKDGYELPEALVYMVGNDGTNLKLSVRGDGSFEQEVKPNVEYVFLGTCKGYLNHGEELRVDTSSVSKEYVLQFPLSSINHPVLIRNVFYEFDSAELTENSTQALDSLVDLLNENPNVTIELASHCDYRGKDEYNERLSQRRAESVVNYLIDHGIDTERLTPVGYGEKRPKVVSRKVAEQNPFLHEGDTLTEQFILRQEDEEKQEICNALNRRTEFKVLRTTYRLFEKHSTKKDEQPQEEGEPETDAPTQEVDVKPLLPESAMYVDRKPGKKQQEQPATDEQPQAEDKQSQAEEQQPKAEEQKPATKDSKAEEQKPAAKDSKAEEQKPAPKDSKTEEQKPAPDKQPQAEEEKLSPKELKAAAKAAAREARAARRAEAREIRLAEIAAADEARAAEKAVRDSIKAIANAKKAAKKAAKQALKDKKAAAKQALKDKQAALKQKEADRKAALKQKEADRKQREADRKAALKQKEADRKAALKQKEAERKQKEADRKAALKQKEADRKLKEAERKIAQKQKEAERKQ